MGRQLLMLVSAAVAVSRRRATTLCSRTPWQTLLLHPEEPALIATTCRALRKLVSLQPQTVGAYQSMLHVGCGN